MKVGKPICREKFFRSDRPRLSQVWEFSVKTIFYGPKGSWYGLEGYLIDKSCEYIQEIKLKPCAETCTLCQKACPYNKRHDWNEGEDFLGLKEIEDLLQPENILSASDEELIQKVIPRAEHHLTDTQTDILRIGAKRVIFSQNDNC